ncbi:uncharacterized protein LOC118431585 [Branchiostoma floridae]|uniref:Uncharacterized protein LOC118431585 n=1 Tax=Branchiostoma floridae TaxID=7739 RepID=A0A9J7NCZ5_BRAFL|nr:uncharacterized protein LOC118431585 [Branchiostoma floridae]
MSCGARIREEFRLQSFHLTHPDRRAFTRTPWFSSPVPFLIYRTVICLYQVCTCATVISLYWISLKNLTYLTQLGYIILTAHTVVSALLCFADLFCSQRRPRSSDDYASFPEVNVTTVRTTDAIDQSTHPWYYKGYWVLYNVAFSAGLFITVAFWALLADNAGVYNILFHAVNSVVIVIDVIISGLPYRVSHRGENAPSRGDGTQSSAKAGARYSRVRERFEYLPACNGVPSFAFAYMLFTAIYWAAGGTDNNNNPWIYPVLDYGGNPALASGIAAGSVLVAIPLCHVILFGLALARETLSDLVKRRSEGTQPEQRREEERA